MLRACEQILLSDRLVTFEVKIWNFSSFNCESHATYSLQSVFLVSLIQQRPVHLYSLHVVGCGMMHRIYLSLVENDQTKKRRNNGVD